MLGRIVYDKNTPDSSRERLEVILRKTRFLIYGLSESRKLSGLRRHSTTVSGEVLTKREESMIRRNMEVIKNLRFFEGKIESDTQKDGTFLP